LTMPTIQLLCAVFGVPASIGIPNSVGNSRSGGK
jgi:hypothetical protein